LRRLRCCYHQKCHTITKANIQSNESNWASPYYAHLLCQQSLQWTWWTCSSCQMTCRFHGNAEWNSRIYTGDNGAPDHQSLTMLTLFSSSVSWLWPMIFLSGTNPWLTLPFSLVEFRWSFEDGSGSTMNTCTWLFSSIYSRCTCFSFLCCGQWDTWLQWDPNCEQHNCCIELQNSNPQKLPTSNVRTIVLWWMLLPSVHHVFTKHQAKPSTHTHFGHKILNWWIFSASCRWPPKMINPPCGCIVSHTLLQIYCKIITCGSRQCFLSIHLVCMATSWQKTNKAMLSISTPTSNISSNGSRAFFLHMPMQLHQPPNPLVFLCVLKNR